MRRLTTGLALIALAFALFGCGGGSSSITAPNNGDPGGVNPDGSLSVSVNAPDAVSGGHSVTNKPGQLNVIAGGTEPQLRATVEQLGYSLISYKPGGQATVVVPAGSEQAAAVELEKQYNIVSAEPVHVLTMPQVTYNEVRESIPSGREASFYPAIPFYSDLISAFFFDGTNVSIQTGGFVGQAQAMNMMGFNTAWDAAFSPGVAAEPVTIAIIDAGVWDFTIEDQPGFDETIIDTLNSGSIDGGGVFTAGLAAAAWETFDDDADVNSAEIPYRETGNLLLGILAALPTQYVPRGFDLDGIDNDGINGNVDPDEIWNEGIAGVNPNASYIVIKTGTPSGTTWTFSDNEIAASIDHAAAAGANIILLGMFANGTVGANVSTAIQDARNADILVVAPAGDVVDSFNGTTFDDTAVDITVTSVTPGSDPNVVSVAATGYNRVGALSDVDFGDGPVVDNGTGWFVTFNPPFDATWDAVAPYSNTGATIAAVGHGMGFAGRPYLQGGTPAALLPGFNYNNNINRFGSSVAAAYVAGSASQIFQILSNVNGVPPTDEEVLAELTSTVQFGPLTGVDTGLLNAGLAAASALGGGGLVTTLPAIRFTSIVPSQPVDAVTRGTDYSLAVNVADGTAPFTLRVDWGEGAGLQDQPGWNNGDTVTLTGGYATLGIKGLTVQVEDANGLIDTDAFAIHVINPLAASITITDSNDTPVVLTNMAAATPYRFNASPANVFTGDGNVTTFSWDFNGDSTEDATGPAPPFTYASSGAFTVTLTITETLRPDTVRTLDVVVN